MRALIDLSHFLHSYYGYLNKDNDIKDRIDIDTFSSDIIQSILQICAFLQPSEIIISTDSDKTYWREDFFSGYKEKRKQAKKKKIKEGKLDPEHQYGFFNRVVDDITKNPIFCIVIVDKAESDDIIATLCKHLGGENVIVARDHDFLQLCINSDTRLYNPVDEEFTECENPDSFLIEQLIQGCSGDSIPSIQPGWLGPTRTETLVKEGKQAIKEAINKDEKTVEAYRRNKTLISFTEIPEDLQKRIVEEYEKNKVIVSRDALLHHVSHIDSPLVVGNSTNRKIKIEGL